MVRLLLALCLWLAVVSCSRTPESAASGSASTPLAEQQIYQAKGVILEMKANEVTIKHDAIPGYMDAMTMPFTVKDTNELAGLEPGMPVSFRVLVTKTEGWIDQIHRLATATNALPAQHGPAAGIPPGASARLAREVEPLQVGALLPEYHFTNQLGQAFSTSQFKGQALAITFLFTRCPFPNFCPRMATEFSEAQQKLLALSSAPKNWHLLTISFDPENDKPEVLKRYAEAFKYDPARWTFATGDLVDITAIGEQFGLAFWHDETGSLSHNLRTAVIDASGRVRKIFTGNQWTSDELVQAMVAGAGSLQR
jgi:protein SCO1/2